MHYKTRTRPDSSFLMRPDYVHIEGTKSDSIVTQKTPKYHVFESFYGKILLLQGSDAGKVKSPWMH